MTDIILASASSRRAGLLRKLGVSFLQRAADIDESRIAGEDPQDYAGRMAREKALKCHEQYRELAQHEQLPVLAADTCVVLEDLVLGKPADKMDALATLARLSGREHRVLTAVCLIQGEEVRSCMSETRVQFLTLQREQIEAYIDSGEPFDKAGSYGIQGLAGAFVERIEGSYSGVVGLPLAQTWQLLQELNIATAFAMANNTGGQPDNG